MGNARALAREAASPTHRVNEGFPTGPVPALSEMLGGPI